MCLFKRSVLVFFFGDFESFMKRCLLSVRAFD